MSMNLREELERELADLQERALLRSLRPVVFESEGTWLRVNGKQLLNLSSNNYLGLAGDPRLKEASVEAVAQWGAGATSSRLVTGNYELYAQVEKKIAAWKGREAALLFGSGYMANVGAITALVGRGDVVFSDRWNHASIVDGIVLSRAEHVRYRHNDMEHLEWFLRKHQHARRKLIVTDSIFSMDGDAANIAGLVELKRRYGAILLVDEAHGTGVYGETGAGYCHQLGWHQDIDVLMGTCSKAVGAYGAFLTGDEWMIRYLQNRARSLIYTTGLPPAVLGAIDKAVEIIQEEGWRREQLRSHVALFRNRLQEAGFAIGEGDSPIIPLLTGSNQTALAFSKRLEEAGIAAVAIRPPTVPEGTARIRFSLMATHRRDELEQALETIIRIGKELGVVNGGTPTN